MAKDRGNILTLKLVNMTKDWNTSCAYIFYHISLPRAVSTVDCFFVSFMELW